MFIQWIWHEFHCCQTLYITISDLERIESLQEKSCLLFFFFWFFIYFLVFLVLFVKSRLGFGFGLKMGLKGATFSKKHSQEQHIAHYTDWSRSQTSVHHFLKSRTFTFFFFRIVVHQYDGETNLQPSQICISKKVTEFELPFHLVNTKSKWKNKSNLNFKLV